MKSPILPYLKRKTSYLGLFLLLSAVGLNLFAASIATPTPTASPSPTPAPPSPPSPTPSPTPAAAPVTTEQTGRDAADDNYVKGLRKRVNTFSETIEIPAQGNN